MNRDNITVREHLLQESFSGVCSKDLRDSYMRLIFIQPARCCQSTWEAECYWAFHWYMTKMLRYIEPSFAAA